VIEIFPQSVEVLPNNRALFTARAKDLTPLWTRLTNGIVRPDASVGQSIPGGGAQETVSALDSGHQLESGVGSLEFTIDNDCLPLATGSGGTFGFWSFFGSPAATDAWQYRVTAGPTSTVIANEAGSTLATIQHVVAVGDKFRVELSNGFRLFINNVLVHERITGFTGGINYPAFYGQVVAIKPSGTGAPRIPPPLLFGDWGMRATDRLGNPVVVFTAPSEGATNANGLTVEYSDGEVPGSYKLTGRIDPGIEIWLEDGAPAGAATGAVGTWAWVNSPPPAPISGALELRGSNAAGDHVYAFTGASRTLQVNQGDILTCYVFLDAVTPPTEIMLEYVAVSDPGNIRRAYWGANSINVGVDGTVTRRFMGPLPPTGQWIRLEIPASVLLLEGAVLNGGSFRLFDGRCDFDQSGRYPGTLQRAEALITIPPLEIFGERIRSIQPGAKIRIETNHDPAGAPPTLSIVSGSGTLSQGEFTAPATPGMTVIRATAATGNQIAETTIITLATISPSFFAVGPGEQIDWDTNIPIAPVFVAAGVIAEGTGAVIPALPAGWQPGDLLRLFVETANEAVTAPAGWAASADSPQGTGTAASTTATRLTIFWKRAVVGEIAPTVADPGEHAIAQILAYRHCVSSGNPWDVTAGNTGASSTSVSIPGDTTTVVNCLVELAVSHQTDIGTAQVSGFTNADLVNLTERTDVATLQGNGGGFAVATGEKAALGAYAATTATLAGASVQGRISTALKPNPLVWTASAGSINSGSGLWTAPSVVGQSVKITASNTAFTATRDVLVLPIFPLDDPALPVDWDRNLTALISMSEDRRSRITRDKAPPFDSYEIKFTSQSLQESNDVDAFFDQQGFGKPFILEDTVRGIRKVGWFDSAIKHEGYEECAHDISFRFLEARL
jgi:hypothetical protein